MFALRDEASPVTRTPDLDIATQVVKRIQDVRPNADTKYIPPFRRALVSNKGNEDRAIDFQTSIMSPSAPPIMDLPISAFRGKTLVFDVSIYMYKFAGNDSLLPSMYLLLTMLRENDITPIFVFDGRPSDAKYEVVKRRREAKRLALEKFYALRDSGEATPGEISFVRKQCVYLSKKHFTDVKALMAAHGALYYDAVAEADPLCAYLVCAGKAWACVSDDTDMFAFGCDRVVRNLCVLTGRATLFNVTAIRRTLCLTHHEFRQAVLLCGSEYPTTITALPWETMYDVWTTISVYRKSQKADDRAANDIPQQDGDPRPDIYIWLLRAGLITAEQYNMLCNAFRSTNACSAAFQEAIQADLAIKYADDCAPLLMYRVARMDADAYVEPTDVPSFRAFPCDREAVRTLMLTANIDLV